MASSVIHMAIASEINKKLKRDNNKLLIGTIAPDISKLIGKTKIESHFLESVDNDLPNLEKFLNKYKEKLDNDFVMGYYSHLFTDYLWVKYFVPEFYHDNIITRLDGSIVNYNDETLSLYIYNDYTNLNIKLIDEYQLDLKIFYNELPDIPKIIDEIPMDKLDIIVNQASIIIENSKKNKEYIFTMKTINAFIKLCCSLIMEKILELDFDNV